MVLPIRPVNGERERLASDDDAQGRRGGDDLAIALGNVDAARPDESDMA